MVRITFLIRYVRGLQMRWLVHAVYSKHRTSSDLMHHHHSRTHVRQQLWCVSRGSRLALSVLQIRPIRNTEHAIRHRIVTLLVRRMATSARQGCGERVVPRPATAIGLHAGREGTAAVLGWMSEVRAGVSLCLSSRGLQPTVWHAVDKGAEQTLGPGWLSAPASACPKLA